MISLTATPSLHSWGAPCFKSLSESSSPPGLLETWTAEEVDRRETWICHSPHRAGEKMSWCNGCNRGFKGRTTCCPCPGSTESPSQRYPAALSPSSISQQHPELILTGTMGCFFFFLTNHKYTRNQRFLKMKFLANLGWSELIISAWGQGAGRGRKEREKSGRGILKKFRNTLFQHLLNKMGCFFLKQQNVSFQHFHIRVSKQPFCFTNEYKLKENKVGWKG